MWLDPENSPATERFPKKQPISGTRKHVPSPNGYCSQGALSHMPISPLAGKPAPKELLVDLSQLEHEYYERRPDLGKLNQMVSFGTSGHRGSPLNGSFTEAHILAISQAICDYRRSQGYDGPLYMGKDTHAMSGPSQQTALAVLASN